LNDDLNLYSGRYQSRVDIQLIFSGYKTL